MRRFFERLGRRRLVLGPLPDPLPGQQTICLLPWLKLGGEVSFGQVRLAPFQAVADQLPDDVRQTADAIARTFQDWRGEPVEPSICWFADRHPTAVFAPGDAEVLRDHIQMAAFAGIASNRYLSHHAQVNATHFHRVFQNFTPGTETLAVEVRRRDGWMTHSGMQIAALRETRPLPAWSPATPTWSQALLDGLAACIDAEDDAAVRLRRSLPLFLQGSELDQGETPGQEIVWLCSAIEQMYEIEGTRDRSGRVARALAGSIGSDWTAPQTRLVNRWVTELYAKRSEIHGRAAARDAWPYWTHALLATVTYVTVVKQLVGAERYTLSERDLGEAAALPRWVEAVEDADNKNIDDVADVWSRGAYDGMIARLMRRFGVG